MTIRSRRLFSIGLALAAVTAAIGALHIRARRLPLGAPAAGAAVGTFHVHSAMSHDGRSSLEELLAAARAARLDFLILTDHNEQYAGPIVRDGVTVLSHAELSTRFGHLIQLGASQVLPASRRRDREIHDHVKSLDGAPIIAHPNDPKRPWRGPLEGAAGIEIANTASSARRHGGWALLGLAPLLGAGLLNPALALAQVYDRDAASLALWDESPRPDLLGFCGVDAHGWIDLELNLLAWTLVLTSPLPEAESERPGFLLSELLRGRFYCAAGLFGRAPRLHMAALHAGKQVASTGETARAGEVDEIVAVAVTAIPGQKLVLFKDGVGIRHVEGGALRLPSPTPGTYRVEVWIPVPEVVAGERVVPILYSQRLRIADPSEMGAGGARP